MPPPTPRSSETPTLAGKLLFFFVLIAPLVAAGWLLYDPYGWLDGMRVNKAGGLVLVVAFGILLALLYVAALLVWAAVTSALEYIGIPLSRPAAAASAPHVHTAASAGALASGLPPGTATHDLTVEEAARARLIGVYCLYAYGDDPVHGWPEAYLETVAVCLNTDELKRERAARPLKPGWDGLKNTGAIPLYDLLADKRVTAEQAREFLRRIDAGEAWQAMEPPLTPEERARAAGIQVYYVQYEDNFGSGGQRDSFPVRVCLTQADAEEACASYGRPLKPGADGYEVQGPYALDRESRPGVVRDVLALAAAGTTGCVTIDSSSW